jgi:maltose/moltooligosaccharide transporter
MNSSPSAPQPEADGEPYRCGTLSYTKKGLVALFVWLLWGDFCFIMMETVAPSIIPLQLKALGVSNTMMGLVLTTLPAVLNMTVCPYVSFKSDRCRSRWGRRIPFILATLPFLCLCLFALGYGDALGGLLAKVAAPVHKFTPTGATFLVIAVFYTLFQFFNMFVNSVYWYLFNDVVPARFLGRFFGLFRMTGAAAAGIYNFFLFEYAESHAREILVGTTILYAVGMGMMCLRVREGSYPPLDEHEQRTSKGLEGLAAFFRESFSHRLYLWTFLFTAMFTVIFQDILKFQVFFLREMGQSLEAIGKAKAIVGQDTLSAGLAGFVAMYLASVFVDRWHPVRVQFYWSVFMVIACLCTYSSWVWIFVKLPPEHFFRINLIGTGLVIGFFLGLGHACSLPALMRTFPKSRFGQFCSAQALLRSAIQMAAGLLVGIFFDTMIGICKPQGAEHGYRWIFAMNSLFATGMAFCATMVYREWRKLGGDEHFASPAVWEPSGREAADCFPFAGTSVKWLGVALAAMRTTILLTVPLIGGLIWWLRGQGASDSAALHLKVLLPASLLICWLWHCLERPLRKSSVLPHHGVLLIVAFTHLALLGIWITNAVVSLKSGDPHASVLFTISTLVSHVLLIAGVTLVWRVECAVTAEPGRE